MGQKKLKAVILYRCDKLKCGEICPNPDCDLTSDFMHARNFRLDYADADSLVYVEELSKEEENGNCED